MTAPLDTIKIRLQLQRHGFAAKYNAAHTVKNLLRNEGITALWKGNVPAEIMYILYGATQFTSYTLLNSALNDLETKYPQYIKINPSFSSLIVGSGAGIASTLTTYPFDLLRTRLAANSSKEFLSMMKTMKNIWLKNGFFGYFAGIKPTMLSVASTTGLMFWSYELAREFSKQYKEDIPFIEGFCGFIAGATSKGITFPLDTLRKRIQVHSIMEPELAPFNATGNFMKILKSEGPLGFYKGFGISLLKTAPTSAISLFVYEYSLNTIKTASEVATTLEA